MNPALAALLADWNNVGIFVSFLRFLVWAAGVRRANSDQAEYFQSPGELSAAFFEDWIQLGDLVQTKGRLSAFAPIYYPIAYCPQAWHAFSDASLGLLGHYEVFDNPAPSLIRLGRADEAIVAFLFREDAMGVPRITSPSHMDDPQAWPEGRELGLSMLMPS